MSSNCLFEFDRETLVYYSGETIKAKVTLTTTEEINCREVYLKFKGEAKIVFHKTKFGQRSRAYYGQETYISNHTTLHPECKLAPGTYNYNFDISLPEKTPSSYKGRYGKTIYELSLVIDRPYHFDNVFRKKIEVIKTFNLNLCPQLLHPLHGEDKNYFCFWNCKSGPIVSLMHTQFGGFAPGQSVHYTLHVDNQSSSYDVNGIRLRLLQMYTFTANLDDFEVFHTCKTVTETSQNERVLRLSKRFFEGNLLIPSVPPTDEKAIIAVNYYIEMDIKTGLCHKNSKITLPLKIGTVPLHQTISDGDQPTENAPLTSK